MKSTKQLSFGISGAPGAGKTSIVDEVFRRASLKYQVLASKDVSRSLARRGVRVNTESQTDDYLAFLSVRVRDMLQLRADLVIYDRTLLDVLVFMELNGHASGWLKDLTQELIRWQTGQLSLYFYVPVEFEAQGDGCRITDPEINRQIDRITVGLLREHRPDFIPLTGSISERVRTVFESLSRLGLNLRVE